MKKLLSLLWLCLLWSVFSGCEKEIVINMPVYDTKMVVEGWIEQGKGPVVILSRSAGYFENIDSASIRNLIVTTAKVTVSDGEREEVLTLVKNSNIFPYYIYEGYSIEGETGKTYKLTVESKGQTFTSETVIPEVGELENAWFEAQSDQDSLGLLWVSIQDHADREEYYRLFTKRRYKDKSFVPVYLSVFSDQYFSGQKRSLSVLRGASNLADARDDLYFEVGDTVDIRFCTLPKAHFDFWRTLEQEVYTSDNPFVATGNNVSGNIDGGALGVWGGYGATYKTVVIE